MPWRCCSSSSTTPDVLRVTGGFVGVDVFFVISGFVITGLLLRERTSTGRTSIVNFYARRVRRILPAATIVILVTVLFSYFYLGVVANSVADDGRWAAIFLSNFHFESVGTNYLSAHIGSVAPPELLVAFSRGAVLRRLPNLLSHPGQDQRTGFGADKTDDRIDRRHRPVLWTIDCADDLQPGCRLFLALHSRLGDRSGRTDRGFDLDAQADPGPCSRGDDLLGMAAILYSAFAFNALDRLSGECGGGAGGGCRTDHRRRCRRPGSRGGVGPGAGALSVVGPTFVLLVSGPLADLGHRHRGTRQSVYYPFGRACSGSPWPWVLQCCSTASWKIRSGTFGCPSLPTIIAGGVAIGCHSSAPDRSYLLENDSGAPSYPVDPSGQPGCGGQRGGRSIGDHQDPHCRRAIRIRGG